MNQRKSEIAFKLFQITCQKQSKKNRPGQK